MARTTKESQQRFLKKRIDYVNATLDRTGLNNVSIYAPSLTDDEIAELAKHFKVVKREFLGYVRFEREVKK